MIEFRRGISRIRTGLGKCLLLAPLAFLGACASFSGMPEPVLNTQTVVASANETDISEAIGNFYSPNSTDRDDLTPEGYRNKIIGTYMMAADLRFAEFRRHLSRQSRGSTFGLDVAILGVAGGASVAAERAANILSAVAAGLTGTRAALNRDVYFDRTLPALFAAMDSARTETRTTIMVNLRRSATEYPLPVALADIASYELAGSLDGAIERVTAAAVQRADEAQQNYAADVQNYTGPPEPGVADIKRRIRTQLLALQAADNRAELVRAAGALNLTLAADATTTQIRFAIEDAMANARTVAAAREFAGKVGVPAGDER